jgi:hypothetical protein
VLQMQDLDEVAEDVSMPLTCVESALLLVAAMNDWPTLQLESLDAFVSELRQVTVKTGSIKITQNR